MGHVVAVDRVVLNFSGRLLHFEGQRMRVYLDGIQRADFLFIRIFCGLRSEGRPSAGVFVDKFLVSGFPILLVIFFGSEGAHYCILLFLFREYLLPLRLFFFHAILPSTQLGIQLMFVR